MPGLETELREAVAARVGEPKYGLWFGDGVRLGVDGDALVVGVPNGFFREWIAGHFARNLIEAAEAVAGRPLTLSFHVDDDAEPPLGDTVAEPGEEPRPSGPTVPMPAPSVPSKTRTPTPTPTPTITPRVPFERPRGQNRPARRLEDFVTGPCNRLAHAAAVEMAEQAGAGFNPLVVHGGIGLGKTHLLEGLGAALRHRHPGTTSFRSRPNRSPTPSSTPCATAG